MIKEFLKYTLIIFAVSLVVGAGVGLTILAGMFNPILGVVVLLLVISSLLGAEITYMNRRWK